MVDYIGVSAAGLLTVTAFGVLADVATGYPLLLSELTVTTALRTAAMSALAAKWMARADSKVMALIGNGAQSEFQAIAFHRMLGVREIRAFDVDPMATTKLERNLRASPELADLKLIRAGSVSEACRGADIVAGRSLARRDAEEITIFDSVGFALEDYSALRFLHSLIEESRAGCRQIDLVPELTDPKDLFGGTVGGGAALNPLRKSA